MSEGLNVAIAGAGIAGLSAAIALRQSGVASAIYERSERPATAGTGIMLAPNGLSVLKQFGLDGEVLKQGARVYEVEIRDTRGRLLSELGIGGTNTSGAVGIERVKLDEILHGAVEPDAVKAGRQLVTLWDSGEDVRLYFADGGQEHADVLIGADGLRSTVRAWMHGASPPRYAGYMVWRGICRGDFEWMRTGAAFETWASGARFGAAPIGAGRVYWWLAVNRPENVRFTRSGRMAEALAQCKYWEGPAAEMIAATPAETILRHRVYDRPALRRWSRGRVTLMGDAAHVMTPNLGQGANQGLEDAAVLGRWLGSIAPDEVGTALLGYQDERIRRANRLVRQSRLVGRIGQMSWRPAVWARNSTVRVTPSILSRWWFGTLTRPGAG